MILAEMLGKFEWEIWEGMTPDELARWVAYLNIQNSEAAKASRKK